MRHLFIIATFICAFSAHSQMVVGSNEPIGFEVDSEQDAIEYKEQKRQDSIKAINGQVNKSPFSGNYYTSRQLLTKPNLKDIHNDENCTITFTYYVDTAGKICSEPVVIANQTTTRNYELVKQILEAVKRDVTYSSGTHKELAKLTINLRAN